MYKYLILLLPLFNYTAYAQKGIITGKVISETGPVSFAHIFITGTSTGAIANEEGTFRIQELAYGTYVLQISAIGFKPAKKAIQVAPGKGLKLEINLEKEEREMEEVVVTGTLKEVSRLESPVPVEVYSPAFFKMNPTPAFFDALQNVNGVRPQLNCNICNTGDIHINGLEGPYTMILIDGMPIVSGLSSVYGLSGIPNAMIKRLEVVKATCIFALWVGGGGRIN